MARAGAQVVLAAGVAAALLLASGSACRRRPFPGPMALVSQRTAAGGTARVATLALGGETRAALVESTSFLVDLPARPLLDVRDRPRLDGRGRRAGLVPADRARGRPRPGRADAQPARPARVARRQCSHRGRSAPGHDRLRTALHRPGRARAEGAGGARARRGRSRGARPRRLRPRHGVAADLDRHAAPRPCRRLRVRAPHHAPLRRARAHGPALRRRGQHVVLDAARAPVDAHRRVDPGAPRRRRHAHGFNRSVPTLPALLRAGRLRDARGDEPPLRLLGLRPGRRASTTSTSTRTARPRTSPTARSTCWTVSATGRSSSSSTSTTRTGTTTRRTGPRRLFETSYTGSRHRQLAGLLAPGPGGGERRRPRAPARPLRRRDPLRRRPRWAACWTTWPRAASIAPRWSWSRPTTARSSSSTGRGSTRRRCTKKSCACPWPSGAPAWQPRRERAQVSPLDVAPTILAWAGVPAPASVTGR